MSWPNDAEVAAVQRRNLVFAESFCGSYDRCIHAAERQVAVGAYELSNSKPVLGGDGVGDEAASREVTEEADLRLDSEAGPQEVHHLSDDELRDQERSGV